MTKAKYEEKILAKKIDKGRLAMIFSISKGRHLNFLLVVILQIYAIFIDSIIPQLIRFIINNILKDSPVPSYLNWLVTKAGGIVYIREHIYIIIIVFMSLVSSVVITSMARRFTAMEFAEQLAKNLRNKLFYHIQKLPFSWHVKNQTGDIIQRCTSDVETIRNFAQNDFFEIFRCLCIMSFSLSFMVWMNPVMTVIAVMMIPVLFTFSFLYYSKIAARFKESDEAEGALQASVQENFTGVRVVRAFGRERHEMNRFDEKNNIYVQKSMRVINSLANYWSFGDMIAGIQLSIVLCYGIYRCVHDGMAVGDFQSFYAYTAMMIWPVRNLGRTLSNFSKATVSAKRIHEILSEEPEVVGNVKKETDTFDFGKIEFKNVSFKYNDTKQTLNNVSFNMEKGKTLGILGGTGSGKSTISYLLTRLYDTSEGCGEIIIGGKNIKGIPLYDIRKNISLVLQEPFLFSKTIKENIISPNPIAEEAEMHRVSTVANIHEAILEFPEKYNTIVGERGVTLSGGQKQRVAIARMLMQKSPVMIFDDSLSAVDTETDAKIRAALKSNISDSAVIIISHRISTLMHSDKILVLHDGAVEDTGTHEELIRREGTYKRIYDLQSAVTEEYK